MSRDLTRAQYVAACERYGFRVFGGDLERGGMMGYVHVTASLSVSLWNLGDGATRRAKLAYLIAAAKRRPGTRLVVQP